MQRVARQWLLLLGAAVLVITGAAPAATVGGANARPPVAGAGHAVPDDIRLHSGLVPRAVDRGTTPERPAPLDLVPATAQDTRGAGFSIGAGAAGAAWSSPAGSGAWGRAPPQREAVPHPS